VLNETANIVKIHVNSVITFKAYNNNNNNINNKTTIYKAQ